MTTRLHRLWQPGNPQTRVFLPNFWMKLVKPSPEETLPPNVVKFIVSNQMTDHDMREYLTKIYGAPVRQVRTKICQGKFIVFSGEPKNFADSPNEKWPDYKEAFVTLRKDIEFNFPNLFPEDEDITERNENTKKEIDEQRKEKEKGLVIGQTGGTWFGL